MTRKIRAYAKHLCLMSATFISLTFANQPLPIDIEKAFASSSIPREQLSVWIAPIDDGIPIVDWQSNVLRPPASVTKALTTGVSLLLLGEDYRWRTEFFTDGRIENGTLNGNLYIKGYGNPYFVEEELRDMIVQLQLLGFTHITGKVVLDNSYFVHQTDMPNAFDGDGTQPYNALPDALSINFRTATIHLDADADGVHVRIDPEMKYLDVSNQMRLNNKRCRGAGFAPQFDVANHGKSLLIKGVMSRKCPHVKEVRVLGDVGDLLYAYFKREWLAVGGTLDGGWLYGQVPTNTRLIYTAESKPLYEQITAMNKLSNNIMTRQLFLTMGAELTQPPGTVVKGRAVVLERLKKMGINTQGMFIDNGSGLSRQTRINVAQIGQFLLAMSASQLSSYFENSLSIAGVDGTLKHRFRKSPLAGNLIGKTGTLSGVKSQAGYLTAKSGRKFAYAMLFESEKKATSVVLMDKLLRWVYANN